MDDSQKEMTPKELRIVVLATAMKLTRSEDQARDLTQTVFERLASTRALSPGASRDETIRHALGVLKSVLSTERTSDRVRRTRERAAGREWAAESTAGQSVEASNLERAARIANEERASRLVAALRARLSDHPLEIADDAAIDAEIEAALAKTTEEHPGGIWPRRGSIWTGWMRRRTRSLRR